MLLISRIFLSVDYYVLGYLVRYLTNFYNVRSVVYYVLWYLLRYVINF